MAGGQGASEFASVLRHLRALAGPCAPPAGVGSFEPLYANEREIVVWYSPAREAHAEGEVTIPCARLAAAWARLLAGERLAREALEADGDRPGRALWLLALLAQVPGVRICPDPLALWWEQPAEARIAEAAIAEVPAPAAGRANPPTGKRRARSTADKKAS
ncbi:MAG TPA: hypothetical protein VF116_14785 [Ktedonobacterales bacterium]